MADGRRPMPEITVRDPNRPERPPDVLVSGGDERPPLDPAVRRRRLRIVTGMLAAAALVAGGAELRERHAEAAEDRRLNAIVDLRVDHEGTSSSFDTVSRGGRLELQLLLHNDGPRDLHAISATVAGYQLLDGPVRLAAGRSAPMRLERTVMCGTSPPPTTPTGDLQLEVRGGAGLRALELPLPVDADEPLRMCGFRPLETVFLGFEETARLSPDVVELTLHLQTRAIGPVELSGVASPPGLATQVRLDGRPRGLPLALTTTDGLMRLLSVRLRITVTDCSAAWDSTGVGHDLPAPVEGGAATTVTLRDETGATVDALLGYPPGLLASLVSESCG